MEQDTQGIELEKMKRHLALKGKDVLEVGCGDGRVSGMLAPLARSLVAIDPNEERVRKAQMSVPGVDFRMGSGEKLEFFDESFDIVAFTFSLHHQNAAEAMSEARRVLRPGGQVIITEPAIEGDMHPLFRIFNYEDDKILAAQEAIGKSGMRLVAQDKFDIEYIFRDIDDVHEYYFGHYGKPRLPEHVRRINESLGEKISQSPMILYETVNLSVLTKI
jgi:ubiquinone/menaquinone biosynthesis C-methylase UbiE